jgi:hypothetical protein
MSTCERRLAACVLAALLALRAGPASAEGAAQDQAAARALFDDARRAMKAGRYEEACPKLDSARKLYEGSGILLNLGDCYEHLGRTASAWAVFGEAIAAAERAGRAEDAAEARRRQAAIEPKLARLELRVRDASPGLVVTRDGTQIDRGIWGRAVPVDPGTHELSAKAPGRVGWSRSVVVSEAGKTVSVEVPELAPATAEPVAPSPTAEGAAPAPGEPAPHDAGASAPATSYWTARRTTSATVAALGALGMGVGGALAIVAKMHDLDARDATTNRNADSTSAVHLGNTATVVTLIGAGLAGTGLLFWLTAPDATVQVGAAPHGVLLRGSF